MPNGDSPPYSFTNLNQQDIVNLDILFCEKFDDKRNY